MKSQNSNSSVKRTDTKKIAILAMLVALSYLLVVVFRIPFMPSAPYLNLDIKDIPIVLGGFIYGPLSAFLMSFVVTFIEMVTVSDSGPIGFLMNLISTVAFALPPVIIYRKNRTLKSAVLGLFVGCISVTAMMLLWNYIITPFYQKVPRSVIKSMLIPVFLPFNLIKSAVNATLAFLLYKPLIDILRTTELVAKTESGQITKKSALAANLIAFVLLVVSVVIMILLNV